MLKKLIYRIELVFDIIEALYEKFKDWFKLSFLFIVWILSYQLILKVTYELQDWPMFVGMAAVSLIFAIYKVKKSYSKLLIMCAIPYYGIFPIVFLGDYWLACAVIMTYFYLFFSVFRRYDKDDIQLMIYNRTVFAVYLSTIGSLLICTIFLSVLSLPFSFLGYYKHKWTIKNYKKANTVPNKVLRVVLALPMIAGCILLMFMSSL